jgi:oligosaccharide repeat unit polymerase
MFPGSPEEVNRLLYLFVSFCVLIISTLLFKKAAGTLSPTKLNMVSYIFYFNIIIQSFIGVTLGILYLDNHYLINKLQDFDLRFNVWLSVLYVMIAMPLGMLLVNKIFHVQSAKLFDNYLKKPIQPVLSKKDSYVLLVFYGLSIISIGAVIYTYTHLNSIPLISLFTGAEPGELSQMRISVSRNFQGNVYIRNILGLGLAPVLAYVAYAYYKLFHNSRSLTTFAVLFINAVLILIYNFEKAPVIMFLLGFIFIEVLIKGRINIKKLISYGLIATVMVLLMYRYIMGVPVTAVFSYSSGPIGRVILSQIAPLYYHFHLFPSQFDFLWGRSFSPFILSFFGAEHVRSSRIVMEYINPAGVEAGTAGVANTLFIGEAYANFALYGLLLSPFIVGFIIQLSYILLQKLPKNPIWVGLFCYLSYSWPVTGGFVDFLYNPGLIFIIFLLIGIILGGAVVRSYHRGSVRRQRVYYANHSSHTIRSST